ncbi:MAG: sulfatase 1 precursor, partial [Rhodobacteraceae bacterium]|nr:sulfatase 1 precursor [Paracoccaceae bacterium]
RGDRGRVKRNTKDLIFHFPWHTGVAESVIRSGKFKLRKDLDSLNIELFDISKDLSEENDLAAEMPDLVQKLDKKRAKYLKEVNAETVTLTRRNYVELLEGGWIENGRNRLAKLKAELVADPSNRQKAFQVDVSQNHVNFQDKQLERSLRLIRMHEERGTADKN